MSFLIYKITYRKPLGNNKSYVGLTQRRLQDRLKAHINESSRGKPRGISPFTLGYAIRDHLQNFPAEPPEDWFVIELLKEYATLEEMRDGEGYWIDTLKTMAPRGFNIMRGGSSVGGPSNSAPCEIFLGGRLRKFISFTAAAKTVAIANGVEDPEEITRFTNRAKMRVRGQEDKPESKYSLVEALGIKPRDDGRTTNLSREAKASGRLIDTARSSRQRRKRRCQLDADGVATNIKLPSLSNPNKRVSQIEHFKELNVKPSTGRSRLAQIAPQIHLMTPREIDKHLLTPQDRSKPIRVILPDGQEITGGINFVARTYSRTGHSFSGIKARLRKLGDNPSNDELLIAIGLATRPDSYKVIPVHPISRKKHCSEWTISKGTRTKTYANQKTFVEACHKALLKYPDRAYWLGSNPTDMHKAFRSLQGRISLGTRDGKTPQKLAESFAIVDDLLEK
ncbi:GIY-YIG nuclease family protein [Halopseudomonas pelagia]|uniref:GIY-YIG nuclease family protein n=1 Tax=Halopseudomonas pelagia TaxID=553151 RepID=UPI0003AB3E69|nr:GIY-YIG nuclease family protein [Halopseudomonas pelagia]